MEENNKNHDSDKRKDSTSEFKGKFKDIIGLVSNAISGKAFCQEDETHEIYIENQMHGIFISLFIKRDEIERQRFTTISVKQGIIKNKIVKNIITFKDLRKVYISITPGSDVVFLFTDNDRYIVLNVFKDTNLDIIHGLDRRGGSNKPAREEENQSYYDEINEERRREINKRRIFITI